MRSNRRISAMSAVSVEDIDDLLSADFDTAIKHSNVYRRAERRNSNSYTMNTGEYQSIAFSFADPVDISDKAKLNDSDAIALQDSNHDTAQVSDSETMLDLKTERAAALHFHEDSLNQLVGENSRRHAQSVQKPEIVKSLHSHQQQLIQTKLGVIEETEVYLDQEIDHINDLNVATTITKTESEAPQSGATFAECDRDSPSSSISLRKSLRMFKSKPKSFNQSRNNSEMLKVASQAALTNHDQMTQETIRSAGSTPVEVPNSKSLREYKLVICGPTACGKTPLTIQVRLSLTLNLPLKL
jgi:hypothetical protein